MLAKRIGCIRFSIVERNRDLQRDALRKAKERLRAGDALEVWRLDGDKQAVAVQLYRKRKLTVAKICAMMGSQSQPCTPVSTPPATAEFVRARHQPAEAEFDEAKVRGRGR
ncbi:hypothetical protein L1787_13360 [Acuticoccus sp. M5D2P5]|uniref:hypothetical protein n=1 Tax=Acuticoccus kalidii TaxID=2910977 RepID=UPI001F172FBD|nr:hypothetical protein [Acuticoccus kalidii]MCF3934393.1 hypothetical protein [Acuticoccus kalidii]